MGQGYSSSYKSFMKEKNCSYEGTKTNELEHGYGKRLCRSGNSFKGEWDSGVFKKGRFVFNGTVYEGNYDEGHLTGVGTKYIETEERQCYLTGSFIEGILEGSGKATSKYEEFASEAEIKKEHGIRTSGDYAFYEGDFINEMFDGIGTLHGRSGPEDKIPLHYEGQFRKSTLHGKVKITQEGVFTVPRAITAFSHPYSKLAGGSGTSATAPSEQFTRMAAFSTRFTAAGCSNVRPSSVLTW